MAEQCIIAHPRVSDAANIYTSSTFTAGLPAENVLEQQPAHVARSTDVNPAYLSFDLGQNFSIDFAAIMFMQQNATHTPLASTATWRLRLGTAQDSWTVFDSDTDTYELPSGSGRMDVWMNKASRNYDDWNWVHSFIDIGSSQTARYARIDVYQSSASWIDFGRVYIGLKYQPPHNFAWGSSIPAHMETPQIIEAEGGAEYPIGRQNRLGGRFSFEHTSEAALMDNLWDINRLRGVSKDIVVIPFPAGAYPMHGFTYGRQQQPATSIIPQFGRYVLNMAVKEMT